MIAGDPSIGGDRRYRLKSRPRGRVRHDSPVIRWIRVAVALVLALALSASVYWGYTLFLLATGLIVFGVAYGWPRLTDSPRPARPRSCSSSSVRPDCSRRTAMTRHPIWTGSRSGGSRSAVDLRAESHSRDGCFGRRGQRLGAGCWRGHRLVREYVGCRDHRSRRQRVHRRGPRLAHRRRPHDGLALARDLHLTAGDCDVDSGRRNFSVLIFESSSACPSR